MRDLSTNHTFSLNVLQHDLVWSRAGVAAPVTRFVRLLVLHAYRRYGNAPLQESHHGKQRATLEPLPVSIRWAPFIIDRLSAERTKIPIDLCKAGSLAQTAALRVKGAI